MMPNDQIRGDGVGHGWRRFASWWKNKRSIFNPLKSGGRSKIWAVDAKAQLEYLRFKHETICGRNQAISKRNAIARRVIERRLHTPRIHREIIDDSLDGINTLLSRAEMAANGSCPQYRPFWSWWSGTGTEAAYRNLHYAEAAIVRLYNRAEVEAEIPDAVRRVNGSLPVDNPTRIRANRLIKGNEVLPVCSADELSFIVAVGHEAADRNRAKLRTFRNVLLIGTFLISIVLAGFLYLLYKLPELVPLCFTQVPPPLQGFAVACPTGDGPSDMQKALGAVKMPDGKDASAVAMLGMIGGVLSGAIFIRGLSSNPTPYNVGIPLALLKIPVGALTALAGIVLLAGDFVPGFSAIDKQSQILGYALVFGFAQQFFTRYLDDRAENLIASLPTKSREEKGRPAVLSTRARK
jgi:hypothetical protein